MSHRRLARRAASIALLARNRLEVRAAVRQVRRFDRASARNAASTRVCWDLDNTLVGSGQLIRMGWELDDAIVEADPVPNMLDFYWAMVSRLPGAEHFFLSARRGSMYEPTLEWLRKYGLEAVPDSVFLVPYADAKPAIWERFAAGTRLVIVDDLSYHHEKVRLSIYDQLVEAAERTADVYIGLDQISEIAADSLAADSVADEAVRSILGRNHEN